MDCSSDSDDSIGSAASNWFSDTGVLGICPPMCIRMCCCRTTALAVHHLLKFCSSRALLSYEAIAIHMMQNSKHFFCISLNRISSHLLDKRMRGNRWGAITCGHAKGNATGGGDVVKMLWHRMWVHANGLKPRLLARLSVLTASDPPAICRGPLLAVLQQVVGVSKIRLEKETLCWIEAALKALLQFVAADILEPVVSPDYGRWEVTL
ncbi:hypothetical protein EYF80_024555 [Liparis tanakae]|uniref:Uncharacterized protein n=1 Tax=Liparis tanakae TaxID=230148 RepID=A0A4Z2HHM3_9TELE|nr:hypothetical protein EYF80_024555 [Liparis tanakae]